MNKLFSKQVGIVLIFVLFFNLAILDFWVFEINKSLVLFSSKPPPESPRLPSVTPSSVCSTDCINKINEATASLQMTNTTNYQVTTSGVREYFIPLGSGVNTGTDWTDVAGIKAYIDPSSYGKIKSIVFEAAIHIPTGNGIVWVRLINVRDKTVIYNSEVSMSGGTPQLLFSGPLLLPSGNKLYQVQMKNQLPVQSNLDSARIHITTY